MKVAALYVQPGGVYYDLPDVEPWGLPERDAREYAGPWPVVAHPPCERWGRYWGGGPMHHGKPTQRKLGDDGGCFASALESVRMWGGVLEHPEASHAWQRHGLMAPPRWGGWVPAGDWQGWTCCVEQGHYGHRARKATWLYARAVGDAPTCWHPDDLVFGPCADKLRLEDGFHTREERARKVKTGICQRLSARQRAATPPAFRDVLLSIARSAHQPIDRPGGARRER